MATPRQRLLSLIKGNPSLVDRLLTVAELNPPPCCLNSDDLYQIVAPLIGGYPEERLAVVALNRRLRVIGFDVLTVGNDNRTVMCPRQIFRWALLQGRSGATGVALAHNHPSGDPTPSLEDKHATRKIRSVGESLGIQLVDHLIIGSGGRYVSMVEEGLL